MDLLIVILPIFIAGIGCGYYLRGRASRRHRSAYKRDRSSK
jgi:hypothetical protein